MKSIKGSRPARRLAVESLESRQMLATASLSGGMLFINGANGHVPENVTIDQAPDGRLTVSGLGTNGWQSQTLGPVLGIIADLKGGNDTISIGTPDLPIPLLTTLNLRLGDGSDTANISVNIPGTVIIDGGMQYGMPNGGGMQNGIALVNGNSQNDSINIDRSLIATLMVNTWAGDDNLWVSRSGVFSMFANLGVESLPNGQRDYDYVDIESSGFGLATISVGASGVAVDVGNEVEISSTLFGSLTVNGGRGIDRVFIDSDSDGFGGSGLGSWLPSHLVNTAESLEPILDGLIGRLPINVGSLLGNLDGLLGNLPQLGGIALPGGLDLDLSDIIADLSQVNLADFDLSDALEDLLRGVDLSFLGDYSVLGHLNVNTQGGNDVVDVFQSGVAWWAMINTGAGDDEVYLTAFNAHTSLFVLLGADDDTLELFGASAGSAFLDGGPGYDGLLDESSPQLGRRSRTIINFEFDILIPEFPNFPT